jgi:hypothetical protein
MPNTLSDVVRRPEPTAKLARQIEQPVESIGADKGSLQFYDAPQGSFLREEQLYVK